MPIQRFYWPAFYRLIFRLNNFMARRMSDMVRINQISGAELTQLQNLQNDLNTILTNPVFPKYRELP